MLLHIAKKLGQLKHDGTDAAERQSNLLLSRLDAMPNQPARELFVQLAKSYVQMQGDALVDCGDGDAASYERARLAKTFRDSAKHARLLNPAKVLEEAVQLWMLDFVFIATQLVPGQPGSPGQLRDYAGRVAAVATRVLDVCGRLDGTAGPPLQSAFGFLLRTGLEEAGGYWNGAPAANPFPALLDKIRFRPLAGTPEPASPGAEAALTRFCPAAFPGTRVKPPVRPESREGNLVRIAFRREAV